MEEMIQNHEDELEKNTMNKIVFAGYGEGSSLHAGY